MLASLSALLEAQYLLRGKPVPEALRQPPPITFDTGDAVLAEDATALFGPAAAARITRIMVTMPSEAGDQPALIRELLAGGMDIMRINRAHDGAAVWGAMVQNLRRA